MKTRDGHPNWNDLAALAEGRTPANVADLHRHLAGCRTCAAAYAEAVRLEIRMVATPDSLAIPAAMKTAAHLAGAEARPQARRPRPNRRFVGALAGFAALALIALLLRPEAVVPPARYPAIQAALLAQAPSGMVLPGLTPAAGSESTVYRDGGAVDLDAELEQLATSYRQRPEPAVAFWLGAGYLAAGRLQAAEALVREARHRHPDDRRLQVLDGMASYRRSDLGRAETLLREVLVRDPADLAARFNLALVLQETGRSAEARQLLDAEPWNGDAWLAWRAAAMRDTLR